MKTRSDALPRVGAGLRTCGWYNDVKEQPRKSARPASAPVPGGSGAEWRKDLLPVRPGRSASVRGGRRSPAPTTSAPPHRLQPAEGNRGSDIRGSDEPVQRLLWLLPRRHLHAHQLLRRGQGRRLPPHHKYKTTTRHRMDTGEPREGTPTTRCCRSLFSPDFP